MIEALRTRVGEAQMEKNLAYEDAREAMQDLTMVGWDYWRNHTDPKRIAALQEHQKLQRAAMKRYVVAYDNLKALKLALKLAEQPIIEA